MADGFVLDFIDDARDASDVRSLVESLQKAMDTIGLTRWAYLNCGTITHNYPKEWVDYYISQNYQNVDPVVSRGAKITSPFRWSEIAPMSSLSDLERAYYGEAMDFGLTDGLGVPIFGGAHKVIFTMASDGNKKEIDSRLKLYSFQFVALAFAFHSIYEKINGIIFPNDSPLSPREAECLLWAARGKTSADIGEVLNITERTVTFHIENAKHKLKVKNRSQAVVKAITAGYLRV